MKAVEMLQQHIWNNKKFTEIMSINFVNIKHLWKNKIMIGSQTLVEWSARNKAN